MKVAPVQPPREFVVGHGSPIRMKDCARIALDPDEQVTFTTDSGGEYDVARKNWGFYATPSLNARLPRFGLRAVLASSWEKKYFLYLVERGREAEFEQYLDRERNFVVSWLDTDEALARVDRGLLATVDPTAPRCLCYGARFTRLHTYEAPPDGEVKFQATAGAYHRELLRCDACGHILSRTAMDLDALYSKDYVDANYGDLAGIKKTFDKINALPPEKSDNVGRVKRIVEFAAGHFRGTKRRSVLDVGAGLSVFPYRMKEAGWDATALDPDARAVRHAEETVGVRGICGDFMKATDIGTFDVISFNKVLEHVLDPAMMLSHAARHLNPGGFVYVELPDGEAAWREGPGREEFFIDHHHVFSLASVSLLAMRAGFTALHVERLREPSTKFTLRTFLVPRDNPQKGRET